MIIYPLNIVGLPLFVIVLALDSWLLLALIVGIVRKGRGSEHMIMTTEISAVIDAPLNWVRAYLSRKLNRTISTGAAWFSLIAVVLITRHGLLCLIVWVGN